MSRNGYRGRKRGTTVLASSGLHYSGLPSPNLQTAMRAFNCANVSSQSPQEHAESVQHPSNSQDLSKDKSGNPSQRFNHTRKRQYNQRQYYKPPESSQKRICDNTQTNNNYFQSPHGKSPIEVGEPSHLLEPRCISPMMTRSPISQVPTYNMQHQPEGTILLAYQPQMANTSGARNLNYSSSPVFHPNNVPMAIQPPANFPSHHNLTYKDLNMGDFITQLCTRENVTVENVTDSFFRELVSMLLEFMDIFPGIKDKIHALLCPLIDFGIMHSTRDRTYTSVSTENANVESSDRRINNITTLLQIDKKIDTLMRQKLNIYPEILKSTEFDVINIKTDDNNMSDNDQRDKSDNRLNDIIPNSVNPNDNISNNNATSTKVDSNSTNNPVITPTVSENLLTAANIKQEVSETEVTKFYPQSQVEQLCKQQLKVIKTELLGQYEHETDDQNVNLSENRRPTSPLDRSMEQADPQYENKANPNLFASNTGSTDAIETEMLNFQLPEIKSNILCINIVQDACIVGCDDGLLMLFSLTNGVLKDSVHPSKMSIVSITVYQNKIITASKDSVLKCYNTSTKRIKSTSVNYPISCTHDNNGRLYVGTTSGHVVVLNLKSLAILCQPTQISSTPVTCITMFETEDVIAVLCEGKPVMLRNSSTGALLQSIKSLTSTSPFISSLVFTDDFSKMICSRRSKLLEYVPSTGLIRKKSVGMKISLLQQHKSLIIVGGRSSDDGCGLISFYSKDGKEIGTITLPGKPIALYVYLDSSIFLSTTEVMLTHVFLPYEVKSYLKDYNQLLARI